MKSKYFLSLLALGFISGCVDVPEMKLDQGARDVVVSEHAPQNNYELIGPVSGLDGQGCGVGGYEGTLARARVDLKNNAYKMGGNYVFITEETRPVRRGECYDNAYLLKASLYKKTAEAPSKVEPVAHTNEESFTKKMRELKALYDEGALTQEEYDAQKKRVLKKGFDY